LSDHEAAFVAAGSIAIMSDQSQTAAQAVTGPVLVVGTGTMGAGIAQVAAQAGHRVFLFDQAPGAAERAKARIADSMERAKAKGYVTAELIATTLTNLEPAASLAEAAAEADVVVEAVKEDLDIKRAVFAQLESLTRPTTYLWTNTSMIAITRIADGLKHPERVVGTHFFNPVPRMKLVEVIAGKRTSASAAAIAAATVARWGKTPVQAPDTPGFLVNRVLDAIKREALALLEEGSTPEQVDTAVRLGLNFPMGPFELMDLVGLDTTYDCLLNQASAMGRPATFGQKLPGLVRDGKHGRKTGSGFYQYEK